MARKIHHLNCATFCLRGGRWLGGTGGLLAPVDLVCHCLLLETNDGLVLVDTGFGTSECENPQLLGRELRYFLKPRLDREETAYEQVRALGFNTGDVRHILVTHLDPDHAGGLADFPQAQVHVWATELEHAGKAGSWRERLRYYPRQWAHGPNWTRHSPEGERWFGFDAVQALPGSEDEILMIPLAGHTRGHCGIAVNTGSGWLLHCGDAYFHHTEMSTEPACPPGLSFYQGLLALDNRQRLDNQRRLRVLANRESDQVRLICAHDSHDLHCCRQQVASEENRAMAAAAAEEAAPTPG